jgi:hypothetical protein
MTTLETCEVCDARPVCRHIDIGDRCVRLCAACSALFRREPAVLLAAVQAAYDDDNEEGGER